MIMKLQELKPGTYSIYLPKNIVEGMDWGKGDELETKILGKDRLELRRK